MKTAKDLIFVRPMPPCRDTQQGESGYYQRDDVEAYYDVSAETGAWTQIADVDVDAYLLQKHESALDLLTNDDVIGYDWLFVMREVGKKYGGKSLVEILRDENGGRGVGKVTHFLSWWMKYPASTILPALKNFAGEQEDPSGVFFYVNTFSLRQPADLNMTREGEGFQSMLGRLFSESVESAGHTVFLIEDWTNPGALGRAWCLLEILESRPESGCQFSVTLPDHQKADLLLALRSEHPKGYTPETIVQIFSGISAKNAEAGNEDDKKMIFARIEKEIGFKQLDELVKGNMRSWQMCQVEEVLAKQGEDADEILLFGAGWLMRLLQQLVGAPYHVCVVGDDDQSIYGWRGAEVANILEFERFFPDPKIIRLEENYRSSEAVLHTANSLIKHNAGRREKVLRATRGAGENVRIVAMPGDDEEADFIADEMLGEKTAHGREWEDFAILFRTNGQSRKLELALRDRKIPYRMVGAQSFYDRREIRDILAYTALLVSPENDVPLLRILNAPNRGIGQATAVLATDYSREHGQSVWQALCDPFFTTTLGAKSRGSIENFVALISSAKNRIDISKENPAEVLSELLKEIDYLPWLERGCKNESERQQRGEAIHSLIESIRDYVARGKNLQSFLDNSALASERDDEDLEKKKGATLITLHASKGLEFPYVYLVGLEEGFLPHSRSISEGTKDEERRLLYVGITRAQESLTLTYCTVRMKWGQKTGCTPSSFIGELDDKFVEHTSFDDIQNTEMSDDDLSSFFASMNNIFAEED